ncbi:MAG: OsmC family protein [Armatimonadetes bacterium]|nr:OsmC family protein [Armatimonadota bacterium]
MGGAGNLPGPLQYCLFGLANCYTALFAIIASSYGIELKKLAIRIEADINFSKVFDIVDQPVKEEISITRKEKDQFKFSFWTIDQPIAEEVRIILKVASNAHPEKIKEIDFLTHSRCPAIYMLKNPIKFTSQIEIIKEE